jgi:hypothetical protein
MGHGAGGRVQGEKYPIINYPLPITYHKARIGSLSELLSVDVFSVEAD